jgi:DNA-binding Xre family transcriptional regulator
VLVINAQRLATAVIESQMGEVEICVKAGVAHQTFAKMLRGQMVRFPSIGRICKVLAVSPAEIIREVPDETLQAQGESLLLHPERGSTDNPKDKTQRLRFAAPGRVSS